MINLFQSPKIFFLRAIGFSPKPNKFKDLNPTAEEFQEFLAQIGYKGDYKANKFKILMHMIVRGLSGKHGGTDTLSKE